MKITICGSMAFAKEMLEVAEKLKEMGHKVLLPENVVEYATGKLKTVGEANASESSRRKIEGDVVRKHMRKVEESDAILVVNPEKRGVKNYIGANTFLEMGYAHYLGKRIFVLYGLPETKYIREELLAFQPVVLEGELEEIK